MKPCRESWRWSVADVAVVTDSTAYLPDAVVESLDIAVVSLYYDIGGGWLRESDFDGDFGDGPGGSNPPWSGALAVGGLPGAALG
jgi:hypothetical protein